MSKIKYKDELDLIPVALIYILIFVMGYFINSQIELKHKSEQLILAKKIVVELDKEKREVEEHLDIAITNLNSVNDALTNYEKSEDKLKKIAKELSLLNSPNGDIPAMVLFTESSYNPNVKHSKKSVRGRCGVDINIWGDELKWQGIKVDSLEACDYIFTKYLEQYGTKKKALLKYKGVETNKKVAKVVDKILQVEIKLKKDK